MLSNELAKWVEDQITVYVSNLDVPEYLRVAAEKNAVLPILIDWTGFWGLRSNGEIWLIDTEYGEAPVLEQNFRIQTVALFQGAKKYPTLISLIPERPAEAQDCSYCDGKGTVDIPNIGPDRIICYCGGTGWLLGEL